MGNTCTQYDMGVWGVNETLAMLGESTIGGVFIWNFEQYWNTNNYLQKGNPVNRLCAWAPSIAFFLGLSSSPPALGAANGRVAAVTGTYGLPANCRAYTGPTVYYCSLIANATSGTYSKYQRNGITPLA
jgi:hypothetical protein